MTTPTPERPAYTGISISISRETRLRGVRISGDTLGVDISQPAYSDVDAGATVAILATRQDLTRLRDAIDTALALPEPEHTRDAE